MVGDLEAGTGTLLRLLPGQADFVLVVVQATEKALEVGRRAARIAEGRDARVIVVANRVRDEEELAVLRAGLGEHEIAVVPDDPAVLRADRDGVAPLDATPGSPAVLALVGLAERLAAAGSAPS